MLKSAEKVKGPACLQPVWKLEDAKARFSELVRRAHDEGPQAATVRGQPAVVIVDADDYERMVTPMPKLPLVALLEDLHMEGLDITGGHDFGREVEL